jgi:dihydrofolate reductase
MERSAEQIPKQGPPSPPFSTEPPVPLRFSVYIAASVDGFIARSDGDIGWLTGAPAVPDEDFGYNAFFQSVDTVVLGRRTFETVLGFDGWPYDGKRVVVLSRTLRREDLPPHRAEGVMVHPGPLPALVESLRESGVGHVYVDGGRTVHAFLAEGLVDTLIVTRVPILIGSGIPLFGDAGGDIPLRHVETRTFGNGFVQSRYEVAE